METFSYEMDGQKRRTSQSFYRGENTNFLPTPETLSSPSAIEDHIIKGWKPASTILGKDTSIVAFGSCFATNISNYLHERGYSVLTKQENKAYITKMGDGLVNTFAILQQFEWAWLNKAPASDLWHGYKAEEFGYDETIRLETKDLLDRAEVFIITLGLSEIWYDEPTGEVFWRAVPKSKYDQSRHKFRVSTHAETKANLESIRAIIRRFRPDARIVFTVSPIPLTATFRDISAISANSVSKSILRSALDEVLRDARDDKNLFYFPSYEIVMHCYRNQWGPDGKHVVKTVLNFNMALFEHFFCAGDLSREELQRSYETSLEVDDRIGRDGHVRDGYSVEELRNHTREAVRQQRIAARIAERKAAREQVTAIRQENATQANARKKNHGMNRRKNWLLKAAYTVAAAAAGFGASFLFS